MADQPVGPYQIPKLLADEAVATVAHSEALAVAINNGLDSVAGQSAEDVAEVAASVTGLGPAWAPFRSVPSGADLNTYRVPGVSRIRTPDTTGSSAIVNLPLGMRSAGHLENIITGDGTDSFWTQRITEQGPGGRNWWRTSSDLDGGWGPWVKSASDATTVDELHVVLPVGQSNESGRAIADSIQRGRYYSPRILQYGFTRRVLEIATVPLDMHDTASGVSPATAFAQNYLRTQPDNVGVLLVPAAHGGTGFTNSTTTLTWTPGVATDPTLDLPASAVKQVQDAITAAKAAGYLVTLKVILWHQGENNGSLSTSGYSALLDRLIDYFRTQFADPALPFLIGQMVPEGIIANSPGRANIDAAHQQTPARVPYTGFAPATVNGHNPGDTTHMSKAGVDYLGRTYLEALGRAVVNTPAVTDTGWRDISALLKNGWTANQLHVRRIGKDLRIRARVLNGVNATSKTIATLPVGFFPTASASTGVQDGATSTELIVAFNGDLQLPATGKTYFGSQFVYATAAAVPLSTPWPTVMPGTPVAA
ncbi:sialate O-acetylesterase [Arthrobacter agilis]|uniref:sialate O-acetylesterase n=1 Tax=Arthrobacter agilis TaxID=37921 RepID=UPI0023670FA4|nr:sialate O-acetylesterase [Arthrobacter agilis]WDF32257.1 sialate O-acetylesterase [Arthrobacter agilis]